jgi:hypothetical protein
MKKIFIFIIITIIIIGFLSAKKAYADDAPDFNRLQTVENLNLNKEDIFDKVLHWFNAYYTSPNKSIKFSNREIGKIIVCSELAQLKGVAYRSKITFLAKNKSYKLMLEPVPHGNVTYKEWNDEYYTEFDNIKKNIKEYLSGK